MRTTLTKKITISLVYTLVLLATHVSAHMHSDTDLPGKRCKNPHHESDDHHDLSFFSHEGSVYDRKPVSVNRLLQASSQWRPFRMQLDTSLVSSSINQTQLTFISKTILGEVMNRFENMLKVNGSSSIPPITIATCADLTQIPEPYSRTSTDTDFILFLKMEKLGNTQLAYAVTCGRRSADNRPVVGVVNVNLDFLNGDYSEIEEYKTTLTHEILHALVFSSTSFDRFPRGKENVYKMVSNTLPDGTQVQTAKIILPSVVAFAKKYYGCESIDGIMLENEGGQGSAGGHWEQKYLGNEMMTAVSAIVGPLSGFTLALINDSGWYSVDMQQAEVLSFARGSGCALFENVNSCPTQLTEFNKEYGKRRCSRDRLQKTNSQVSDFSNGCKINVPWGTFICTDAATMQKKISTEVAGVTSRCIDVLDMAYPSDPEYSAACQPVTCNSDKTFSISIDGSNFKCTSAGQKITDFAEFTYVCPAYSEVCGEQICPGSCSGNGSCLENGKCYCDYFYWGDKCQYGQDCHNDDQSICDAIRPKGLVIRQQ